MNEAWGAIGQPVAGGVLLIGDHALAVVPDDIDLGIAPDLLAKHIAVDLGVAEVAELLVASGAVDAAIFGGVSRLVADCNRDEGAPGVIPIASDGHAIPGNAIDHVARETRLARFYRPYHDHIAAIVAAHRPALIVSLHSFTPVLESRADEARPWDVGVLYNRDNRLVPAAIACLLAQGLNVGDQRPYSGELLNATMNRHAEAHAIPYVGIEMRQDHVRDRPGQARFAQYLGEMIANLRNSLA